MQIERITFDKPHDGCIQRHQTHRLNRGLHPYWQRSISRSFSHVRICAAEEPAKGAKPEREALPQPIAFKAQPGSADPAPKGRGRHNAMPAWMAGESDYVSCCHGCRLEATQRSCLLVRIPAKGIRLSLWKCASVNVTWRPDCDGSCASSYSFPAR